MIFLYVVVIVSLLWFCLSPKFLGRTSVINYFYLKMGFCLGVLPLLAFTIEFPRYIAVFLKSAPYFIALCFVEEIIGLRNGHWTFPGGHFIGWVTIQNYRFPYEELFFWIILFSSSIIVYFELFDDNRLKFRPFRRG
jgi:hypothetical protein